LQCISMKDKDSQKINVGWSTLSSKEEAVSLVDGLISANLIACGQIDGPILSAYRWLGEVKQEEEWRIVVKFGQAQTSKVEEYIKKNHPYENPQWVWGEMKTTKEYDNWAKSNLAQ